MKIPTKTIPYIVGAILLVLIALVIVREELAYSRMASFPLEYESHSMTYIRFSDECVVNATEDSMRLHWLKKGRVILQYRTEVAR